MDKRNQGKSDEKTKTCPDQGREDEYLMSEEIKRSLRLEQEKIWILGLRIA